MEVVFEIELSKDLDAAWNLLEEIGCELFYSTQDESIQQIFGRLPVKISADKILKKYPFILSITNCPLPAIDWEAQWAAHGIGYRDGLLHVDMNEFSHSTLVMQPGPGFGDLSHPTTRLMLRLMSGKIQHKDVLDVGCGSGVLSLAALAMGAAGVWGVDIDEGALEHARANAGLNGMEIQFLYPEECVEMLPKNLPINVLMNMIQSEQTVAWESLKAIHSQIGCVITSGVLADEEEKYLCRCTSWGWRLIDRASEEGWVGYIFTIQ